jgi:hypothetical protein
VNSIEVCEISGVHSGENDDDDLCFGAVKTRRKMPQFR